MVEIVEINPKDKRLFKKFIEFPNKLYKGNSHYVPCLYGDELNLLDPSKNASFENCKARYYLAYYNGEIAGRICGIIQMLSNSIHNEKIIRFSRIDFIENIEVVKALLSAVEQFGKSEGMEYIHGPLGFNDLDKEGMLDGGFEYDATLATLYNYEYYPKLLKQCGYEEKCIWQEYRLTVPEKVPDKVLRVAEIAEKHNKLRYLVITKKSDIKKDWMHKILDCYDETYSVLPGTVPLSRKLRSQLADQFMMVVNLRYLPVIINEKDEVVAYGLSFPLVSKCVKKSSGHLTLPTLLKILKEVKNPTGLELGIVGVKLEYRKTGAIAMVLKSVIEQLNSDGIAEVETNPELIDNHSMQTLWSSFERLQHKHRISLIKKID